MSGYVTAKDEIFGLFETAWNAGSAAIAGSVPEVRYLGKELAAKPPLTAFWIRLSIQTVLERQSAMSTNANASRRYRNEGLVYAYLSCPKTLANSFEKGQQLAIIARNAWRGKQTASGVTFYNCRIIELPSDGDAYRFNIVANYRYHETG